jgi:hypothetical protein
MANTASENRITRLQNQGARVREDIHGLTAELEGVLGDFEKTVRTQLAERPYATLAAAGGLGWVLGGGVPTALTRLLFGFGGRMAFVMLMQQLRENFTTAGAGGVGAGGAAQTREE